MAERTEYEENRVMAYIEVPRIKEFCPKEEYYFEDKTFYLIYKTDDLTYPDVAKITTEFYDRPMLEYYMRNDTVGSIERFLNFNIKEKENIARLIEELSQLEENKIEEIFERYRNILYPTCSLYKLCYYWPILCITLDMRIYKGKPTVIKRSMVVYDIIRFIRGEITKEELYNNWPRMLEDLDITDRITNIACVTVREHERELIDDRFVNKKGEIIPVKRHVKLLRTIDRSVSGR